MAEQGDGPHAWANEGQLVLAEGDWGDNPVQQVIVIIPGFYEIVRPWDPEQLNNNNNDHIDLDNFFNVHNEIDNSNADDENDDSNADDENDHNYANYNFADDNQNADSSNDVEERNEGRQDENALAGAEVDYEVNPDAGEVEEDLLLGGFGKRFREEDSEDEKSNASKHFHWWDEFADRAPEEEDSLPEGNKESDEGNGDKRGKFK